MQDAVDLRARIAVIAGGRPSTGAPCFSAVTRQLLGAGIVGQSILWEDAQIDVRLPSVVGGERADCLKAAQPDPGVDLDLGAHARRAVD